MISDLLQPFYDVFSSTFLWSSSRHYWLYMVGYVAIAAVLYLRIKSLKGSFLSFMFPREVYTHPSAVFDFKIWLALILVIKLGVFPLIFAGVGVASSVLNSLLDLLGPSWQADRTSETPDLLDRFWFTVLATACADFGFFFMHYLQHKISWLWVFHKVHHSAEVLTPVTANRHHPVDYILEACAAFLLGGLGVVIFTRFHGTEIDRLTILNASAIHFFYYMGANFRHSHLWLCYGKVSTVFVSPAMHQVHHSIAPQHFNKNFGFIFSVWDWMFRTRYIPIRQEDLKFGLPNDEPGYSSLVDALFRPFRECITQLRQWRTWHRSRP